MEPVGDGELLYRRVLYGGGGYRRDEKGAVRISKMAFSDRARRVSVDRALLCSQGAGSTQGGPEHGVLALMTDEIRASRIPIYDAKGTVVVRAHALDVEPAPLENNPAHAEIVAVPDLVNSQFHKMQQRLAEISSWVLYPRDVRPVES